MLILLLNKNCVIKLQHPDRGKTSNPNHEPPNHPPHSATCSPSARRQQFRQSNGPHDPTRLFQRRKPQLCPLINTNYRIQRRVQERSIQQRSSPSLQQYRQPLQPSRRYFRGSYEADRTDACDDVVQGLPLGLCVH